jgi:hypothetical protein
MAKQIPLKQVPAHRSVDDIVSEIKTLYFKTTSATIDRDFDRAIDLLKEMPLPEDRQRATVYMEGLAEMRRDWQAKKARRKRRRAT